VPPILIRYDLILKTGIVRDIGCWYPTKPCDGCEPGCSEQ
jgi:hypothetical protein